MTLSHLIERVFSSEQKHQIIEKLTGVVSIEGERMRGIFKISEVTSGDWGVGGRRSLPSLACLIPRDG